MSWGDYASCVLCGCGWEGHVQLVLVRFMWLLWRGADMAHSWLQSERLHAEPDEGSERPRSSVMFAQGMQSPFVAQCCQTACRPCTTFAVMWLCLCRNLTRELLDYLAVCDSEFKPDLTAKIAALITRFAPDRRWHFDNLLCVLVQVGGRGWGSWLVML